MSHVLAARSYAEDVVAGKILAAQPLLLACQRQLSDLDHFRGDDEFRFDEARASHVCRFIEGMPHIKGVWARNRGTIKLEPWQCFIITTIFGWLRPNGTRRFRSVYIEVPRKNAKSTLTSAVSLYMLTLDGEEGAEVYSAATTRDQAAIVFRDAVGMVSKSPKFRRSLGVEANALSIHQRSTNSRYMALSSTDHRLDGLNPHLAIMDEVHAMKDRGLYDVLDTAMGARSQPLLWMITTAGSNKAGICYEQHGYVKRILTGTANDDSYFGIIYTIDEKDDFNAESSWQKANPNYGVSVRKEYMVDQAKKAAHMASQQPAFLTKHLDVWVNADVAWLDMLAWGRCADSKLQIEDFYGRSCYIGVDLATRKDIAAVAVIIPLDDGKLALFGRFYLPEETVEADGNQHYQGYARQGRLIATEGAATDFEWILDDLVDFAGNFDVRAFCFDPWQAGPIQAQLQKRGVHPNVLIEVPNNVQFMSPAMKELEVLVLTERLRHDADPVMTWMMGNVVCHYDAKDNVFPLKERYENKIDGPVATMFAVYRWMVENGYGASVYNTRGLISV